MALVVRGYLVRCDGCGNQVTPLYGTSIDDARQAAQTDGWTTRRQPPAIVEDWCPRCTAKQTEPVDVVPYYDLVKHLHRQRMFSERTFGPGVRTQGVVDHIRKELAEIEQAPGDLAEWIDVVLLALDGAWRSGATPEQIAGALLTKQARNETREWPDWRTADPDRAIEHVRE